MKKLNKMFQKKQDQDTILYPRRQDQDTIVYLTQIKYNV